MPGGVVHSWQSAVSMDRAFCLPAVGMVGLLFAQVAWQYLLLGWLGHSPC